MQLTAIVMDVNFAIRSYKTAKVHTVVMNQL